jgi:hypothetical protein
MRRLLISLSAILFLVCAPLGPAAQTADESAIRGTIRSQLDAFLADDVGTAFGFASPMIRSMFGNADRFGMMVRQGYPMVWRPAEVEFLGLRERGGQVWQMVLIRDGNGVYHTLAYQMVPDGADGWRINGVQILREGEAGA